MSRVERKKREKKARLTKKVALGATIVTIGSMASVGCNKNEQSINNVNEAASKRVLNDGADNKSNVPVKKSNVETKKEAVYKYVNADNVPAYSMADAPKGFKPLSYVNLGLNDVVEEIRTKGNSTEIRYNGFRAWVYSKFLSDEKISEQIASETKENVKVASAVVEKEETTKEDVITNSAVVEKEETAKEDVIVDSTVVEKEETTEEDVIVDSAVVEKEETTEDSESNTHVHGVCSGENHDEYTCVEGIEFVEGDCDELTRDVIATNIHGQDALLLKKGQGVDIGQNRGNGFISVIGGKNIHGKEVELVIKENALKSSQVDHTDDCTECIPSYNFGRFSNAYAKAKSNITIYPNACNDKGGITVNSGQTFFVIDELITENGRVPVCFDEKFEEYYWAELDSLECDKRSTEIMYLIDDEAITLATVKDIVVSGYGFEEGKKVTIPAFSSVKVWLESFDGSSIVVSYNGDRFIVAVEDAIAAGIYK